MAELITDEWVFLEQSQLVQSFRTKVLNLKIGHVRVWLLLEKGLDASTVFLLSVLVHKLEDIVLLWLIL